MNEQLPVQLSFDVSLPERAQRIRDLVGTARTCIIEIGRELIAARKEIRGEKPWEDWLDVEFVWSEATAKKFITVAKAFGSSSIVTSELTIDASALYALATPDVPQEARDAAIEHAEDGDHVTLAQAEDMIAAAVQAERANFELLVAELQAAAEDDDPGGGHSVAELIQRLCEAAGEPLAAVVSLDVWQWLIGDKPTNAGEVYDRLPADFSRFDKLFSNEPVGRALAEPEA